MQTSSGKNKKRFLTNQMNQTMILKVIFTKSSSVYITEATF